MPETRPGSASSRERRGRPAWLLQGLRLCGPRRLDAQVQAESSPTREEDGKSHFWGPTPRYCGPYWLPGQNRKSWPQMPRAESAPGVASHPRGCSDSFGAPSWRDDHLGGLGAGSWLGPGWAGVFLQKSEGQQWWGLHWGHTVRLLFWCGDRRCQGWRIFLFQIRLSSTSQEAADTQEDEYDQQGQAQQRAQDDASDGPGAQDGTCPVDSGLRWSPRLGPQ